jgi:hypothetical protein
MNLLTCSALEVCVVPCCTFDVGWTVTATIDAPLAVCNLTGLPCLTATVWFWSAAETWDSSCAWVLPGPWTLMPVRAPAKVEEPCGRRAELNACDVAATTCIVCFVPWDVFTGITLGVPLAKTTGPRVIPNGALITCVNCWTVIAVDNGLEPTISWVGTLFFPLTWAIFSFCVVNFLWASSCCWIWNCLMCCAFVAFIVGVIVLPAFANVTPETGIVTVWVTEISIINNRGQD